MSLSNLLAHYATGAFQYNARLPSRLPAMSALLHHPYFIAALAPFLVALLTAELLLRLRLSGLALIAGFAITVFLVADFALHPLTLTPQIIWLTLAAGALGVVFSLIDWTWLKVLLPLAGGVLAAWVLWPLVQHDVPIKMLILLTGSAGFVGLLVWGMDTLSAAPLRAANAATTLGISTAVAVWGSSTLYGEFALSMGCAAAAHLLIQIVSKQALAAERGMTLPAGLGLGIIACVALVAGHLPWYCLPLMAAIPLLAWVIPLPKMAALLQSLLLSVMTVPLALGVVYLARHPL
ncbi:MAG: hypothetical protein ACXW1C_00360 [Gallionella sp.]